MMSFNRKYLLASSAALLLCVPLSACQGESSDDSSDQDGSGGKKPSSGGGVGSGGKGQAGDSGSGGEDHLGGGAGESHSGGTAGALGTGGSEPESPPLYAVVTQVFGADAGDTFSYLIATESGGELDLGSGIEINGRAIAAGMPNSGSVFVATDLSPTITRYDLAESGALEKGPSFSLLPAGLTGLGEYAGQFHFVSEEKAYFFDGSTAQLIIWNPQEMKYVGKVSLGDLIFEGEILTFGGVPIASDGKVMAFPGWRTTDNLIVPSRAAVVSVDTETDEVEIEFIEDRCGYVRDGVLAADGYVYLATEAYGASVFELNDANADAPCLLRFDVEAGSFDEAYSVDLTTLFDGDTAGTLLVDAQNQPYLLRLDPSLYSGPPAARPLASSQSWLLAKLTTGDEPSVEMLGGDPLPGSILPQYFGDDAIVPIYEARDSTELFGFSNGLGPLRASVPGLVFSVVKVR